MKGGRSVEDLEAQNDLSDEVKRKKDLSGAEKTNLILTEVGGSVPR